eukprot:snap_masked-scaffold_12-processed-gene-6.8-mRNA-1 protein AED:1.00 eAED:1.00 QI:0/0/0/0/1/1/2/0/239
MESFDQISVSSLEFIDKDDDFLEPFFDLKELHYAEGNNTWSDSAVQEKIEVFSHSKETGKVIRKMVMARDFFCPQKGKRFERKKESLQDLEKSALENDSLSRPSQRVVNFHHLHKKTSKIFNNIGNTLMSLCTGFSIFESICLSVLQERMKIFYSHELSNVLVSYRLFYIIGSVGLLHSFKRIEDSLSQSCKLYISPLYFFFILVLTLLALKQEADFNFIKRVIYTRTVVSVGTLVLSS